MHPRIFLHRSSEGPRAGGVAAGSPTRHPLGFADVRSEAVPAAPQSEGPLGYTPDQPSFVTEISFRRTGSPVRPMAGIPTGAPGESAPAVGHAVARDLPVADDPVLEPPVAEEKVPFYKREISLRRKKSDEPAVVGGSVEVDDPSADDPPDSDDVVKRAPIGYFPREESTAAVDPSDDEPAPASTETHADAVDKPADAVKIQEAETPVLDVDETIVAAHEVQAIESEVHAVEAEPVEQSDGPSDAEVETPATDALDPEPSVAEAPVTSEEPAASDAMAASSAERPRRGGSTKSKSSGGMGQRGARRVVGLKLGASQIAAAVVAAGESGPELVQLARNPLADGIIVDGEVRDPDALRAAVKAFFEEHKLPKKGVRIGVGSNRVGVRTFDIVGIDDQARFDNAVRFKAHEVLPVSVNESVLDYRVIDERVTETGDTVRRVLLVVAPRDQVEPFMTACRESGVSLSGVDLEALALLRAFVDPQPFALRSASDTATVVVSIGHESSTLLVAGAGAAEFTRVFEWGGSTLQSAIEQALDVPAAEAASILRGTSLSGPGKADLDDVQRAKVLDAVRSRLTPFARELVSSLQFYQAQNESLGIGEIVITGGTSHLEGLAAALNQMIGVSVRVGDPLARVIARGPIDPAIEATLGSLAVPIGLGIEDDAARSVNLLPEDLRKQGRKRPSALAIAVPLAVAVPLAALAFMFVQANGDVNDEKATLAATEAQIAALPEPSRATIDPALATEQAARATALASVLGSRVAWERVFGDVSKVLPADVSLVRLAATAPVTDPATAQVAAATPTTPGPAAAQAVEIEGYTFQPSNVARLLSRLSTIPGLSNVQLVSAAAEDLNGKKIVRFTVRADLNQSGGA